MKRLLLFAALIAWSGMASAVVYKWVDAQGKLQYGDRPPDGVHAEVVELLGTHAASPSTRAAPAASSASTPKTANNSRQGRRQETRRGRRTLRKSRDKQCTDAQERYKKLIEGRKSTKPVPTANAQFMTSEEIDTERLNAKRDIDTICNSTT